MLAGCSDAVDGNGVAAGIIVTRTCPLWIDVQCVACGWSGVGFRWELAKCVSGCVYMTAVACAIIDIDRKSVASNVMLMTCRLSKQKWFQVVALAH